MPQGANNGKKYAYIWVSLIILIFGVLVIPKIVERLKGDTVVQSDRMAHVSSVGPLEYIIANGQKRKVPDFEFLNQDSVLVSNKDMLGKVYVVEFFFTSCPTICPIMTQNLLELQNTFGDKDDFGIISITIDPIRDTPSRLKRYAEKKGVSMDNWHFLTGERDKIYQLAQEGFYMIALEDEAAAGGFEHSGLFALIDKEGNLRSRRDEFGNPIIYYRGTITEAQGVNSEGEVQQITNLKEDIKKLLAE